jgi:hypothetical protein
MIRSGYVTFCKGLRFIFEASPDYVINSINEKEKNMLLTAISRAPSSGLVNIPLFIQIWNHWYLNKDTLIEDKIDMNENEKQIYYLIKLKYDKLLHIIETLSVRLKSSNLLFI